MERMKRGTFPACPGIYLIKNSVNGKKYVGSAVNIRMRIRNHRTTLNRGKHTNHILQRSWDKYGAEAFEYFVLEYVEDKSELIPREQSWIDRISPEYNICKVAGSRLGRGHTQESKDKVGAASRARGAGNKKGLKLSLETRQKISVARMGKKLSRESIEKREKTRRENAQSLRAMGIPAWNSGKQFLSPEKLREVVDNNRGEKNKTARLTEVEVREIKRRVLAGEVQQRIADELGVPQSHISRIKLGKSWSHVIV